MGTQLAFAQFLINNALRAALAVKRMRVLNGKNATQLDQAIIGFRDINNDLEDNILKDNEAYREAETLAGR
tara:strand:+ start:283 stop:495 length:213 start_codon:yes stop_codon:yes gene_type:complete